MLHIGPVATGSLVSADPQLRQEFSSRYGVLAFNQADLAAVIESIYGNRKDQVNGFSRVTGILNPWQVPTFNIVFFQYMLILGMTDYRDGTREREWQQYSVLMAAAVLKAIVEDMPPPE